METILKHKHNINLGIAVLAGGLIVLGTLLGELIPVMSIWYLNNSSASYQAYITFLGFSVMQGTTLVIDSQVHLFSQILIGGMAAGGIIIVLGMFRGFHKGVIAGTMVTFLSMVTMALLLPAILQDLATIPQGFTSSMADATLSPTFTFYSQNGLGFQVQALGGGYWLVGAGAVLGFWAWLRLKSTISPEEEEVVELEEKVEHTVRHIEIERAVQARIASQSKSKEAITSANSQG